MSTGIFVIPAAMFFIASSLLFIGSKKAPPDRVRIIRLVAGVSFAAGLLLLVLGVIRIFGE